MEIIGYLSQHLPALHDNLRKARMDYSPEDFIKRTLVSSVYMSLGLAFILFLLMAKAVKGPVFLYLLLIYPVMFIVMFFYFLQVPVVRMNKIHREVNKEIIFAVRFLVVELESGVTLYEALKNTSRSYPNCGMFFREIINKTNIGTSIEVAVSETIDTCASESLIKILWQLSNSLKTGSNIASPLKAVAETLVKEQQIQVNEYAKKLNPLAMFYMMIAIIMPSLGVTMLTIISIFIGLKIDLPIFMIIAFMLGFVQFMFVSMISSMRPPVEL